MEDFANETLLIEDTYGDYVTGGHYQDDYDDHDDHDDHDGINLILTVLSLFISCRQYMAEQLALRAPTSLVCLCFYHQL